MSLDNPYVEQAQVFLKKDWSNIFVIAYMRMNKPDRKIWEDPMFLRNKDLRANVRRIAGFEEKNNITILYHAESPEQADSILTSYLEGKGYSVGEFPVYFEKVEDSISSELEEIATNCIRKYMENTGKIEVKSR